MSEITDTLREIHDLVAESEYKKGYQQGRADAIEECINTIVSTASEVALREPFNEHLFTVMADRQNEIIKLLEQLKSQDSK